MLSIITDLLGISCHEPFLIVALYLPLSMYPHLHFNLSQKIAVLGIFALALFVVALDTMRFAFFLVNPTSMDNLLVWNIVECAVINLVANAPTLRPLLFKEELMRGGSIRGVQLFSRVVRKHRRAQSTPWSSLVTQPEQSQYGRNRLSGKSFVLWNIEEIER